MHQSAGNRGSMSHLVRCDQTALPLAGVHHFHRARLLCCHDAFDTVFDPVFDPVFVRTWVLSFVTCRFRRILCSRSVSRLARCYPRAPQTSQLQPRYCLALTDIIFRALCPSALCTVDFPAPTPVLPCSDTPRLFRLRVGRGFRA